MSVHLAIYIFAHVCPLFTCWHVCFLKITFLTVTKRDMSYHIYGDSNICRFLPTIKARSTDPQYETITFTKVTNLVVLRDALTKPEASHPVVVISALTNLLVAKYFDNFDAMLVHCKAIFTDLQTWIQEGRDACSGFATQVCIPLVFQPT